MREAWVTAGSPEPAAPRKEGTTSRSSSSEMGSRTEKKRDVGTEEETSSSSSEMLEQQGSESLREKDPKEDAGLERRLAVVEKWMKKRKEVIALELISWFFEVTELTLVD
uniref:Uncharacterized protein n=1 Tax=Sphaerodactylus townsendi TaxID=933632 RepID=A0ACB8FL31_9SAUR